MSSSTFELNKNTILKAGAGAGKTTTLTSLFLDFAVDFKKKQQKFPRIVVTTFTRKATQELKERLAAEALKREEASKEAGIEEANDESKGLFHFTNSKSSVQISTIHGILSLFMSRYGSVAGLTPDFKILSDSEIGKSAKRILRKHLLSDSENQELLEHYDFALIEGMLHKYFNESLIHPNLSFVPGSYFISRTQKVLQEFGSQLGRIVTEIQQADLKDNWISYCSAVSALNWKIGTETAAQDMQKLEQGWDDLSKPSFLKKNPAFDPSLHEELADLKKTIDKFLGKSNCRPSFWSAHEKLCQNFERLAKAFKEDFLFQKLTLGQISMSDLESLSYMIAENHPEAAEKFSEEWDFWMIDEYQDTSPVQVKLLQKLIGSKPVFIVGDPQQSIYLFRGARSEVFQDKMEQLRLEGGAVHEQLNNYRSSPEILSFFNHYFTKISKQFSRMNSIKDLAATKEPVVDVLLTHEPEVEDKLERTESSEALACVARIQELLSAGVSPEQICVLGRTHKILSETSTIAQHYGVPLQLHSGSGFYERREILDALSILKFLLNPHDNINLVALLRTPWIGVEDSFIAELAAERASSYWKKAVSYIDSNIASVNADHPIQILLGLLKSAEVEGFTSTFKKALIELGLFDFSASMDSSGRREANLWKLVTMLTSEEKRPGFNFLDFLDNTLDTLSTDEASEDSDATPVIEPKRVNFMTVHASKGLQFEQVILIGMAKDQKSSNSKDFSVDEKNGTWTLRVRNEETQAYEASLLADEILEELRKRESEEYLRVLYVALTRAKFGATLIWNASDVKDKSWAGSFPLNTEEGIYEVDDFVYRVRRENLKPVELKYNNEMKVDVRSSWSTLESHSRKKSISITEILESGLSSSKVISSAENLAKGLARAQQGTDAHRLFESLKYADFESVIGLADDKLKSALKYISQNSEVPFMEFINQGAVEWGFAYSFEENIFQGQIDLWGIHAGTAWVVDYKTGSQNFSESAFKQLEFYAWILERMGLLSGIQKVNLIVVYPLDEKHLVQTIHDKTKLAELIESKIRDYLVE